MVMCATGSLLRAAWTNCRGAGSGGGVSFACSPDFSTAEYMRKSVLLEHAEDQELLREGLIKAGLPA